MAEEERALLGPDGGDGGSAAPPRALPAVCDPSRLPHRLLVLALMCFLGFGAWRRRRRRRAGASVRRGRRGARCPEASLPFSLQAAASATTTRRRSRRRFRG